MDEFLSADNIFTDEEVGRMLGGLDDDHGKEPSNEQEENETQEDEPVVEDLEEVFSNRQEPKSVGNEGEPPAPGSGSPTPTNLFKSIAAALREEGVFPDLDDDTLNGVNDAGSLRKLFDDAISAGLTEQQRRVSEALNYGVQPSEIQQYESALQYLNAINDEALEARNEQGDELRRRLIYQDLINRGYSQEKAFKEVKKSVDAGTDIEDAKDAFIANKEFFNGRYQSIVDNAKQQRKQAETAYNERAKNFEKSLLEDKKVFGDIDLDKGTRKRVLDVLTKPTKRDDNGRYYTELQWAQASDPDKFSRNIGLLYVLTDGFTSVEKLIAPQVKQRSAKGLADLERVINDTQRNPDGSLRLMSGVNTDPESFFSGDIQLDI